MIADYGIFLQIFGFILIFLYVANTNMSQFRPNYRAKCILESTKWKVFNKTKKVKVFNKTIDVNRQFFLGRVVANISGLILQHSWFFNNFPEI